MDITELIYTLDAMLCWVVFFLNSSNHYQGIFIFFINNIKIVALSACSQPLVDMLLLG
jgi:hypothetical protein